LVFSHVTWRSSSQDVKPGPSRQSVSYCPAAPPHFFAAGREASLRLNGFSNTLKDIAWRRAQLLTRTTLAWAGNPSIIEALANLNVKAAYLDRG
jgi:hypothetical protein